MEEENII